MMSEKAMVEPYKAPEVYKWEMDECRRRLDRAEKKLRIIIAIFVEKKMIGEALQKAIEETEAQEGFKLDKKTLEWLMSN